MSGDHAAGPMVVIDGHEVDTSIHPVDRFYSGRTGERITDAQWDAETALRAQHESTTPAPLT